jgi:endo-1,4-beta-xylanase
MMMNRREMLLASMGSLALGCASGAAVDLLAGGADAGASLKGATRKRQIGIAADKSTLQDPAAADFVRRNFNLLTASGMKWDRIRHNKDEYDFSEADWNVDFAQRNGMAVHGHNLCWNSPVAYPGWFKTDLNKDNAKQILTEHITTVMRRYAGRVSSWDVVNEPVVPWSKRPDGLYPGIWIDVLGLQYFDVAFHAAAAADPKALRMINIYRVEHETPDCQKARRDTIALLKQLLSRGVPIQGVGIESHLEADLPLPGPAYKEFLDEIRSMKLELWITELDVLEDRSVGTGHDWDVTCAKYYGDYLSTVLPANPSAVIFWSLRDGWFKGKKIQGLLEKTLRPRLTYQASLQALQQAG